MNEMLSFMGVLQGLAKNVSMHRCGFRFLPKNPNSHKVYHGEVKNVRLISGTPFILSNGTTKLQQRNVNSTNVKATKKRTVKDEMNKFQADTRLLLDIVASSLYSEKEICVRELISNASDALENFRYLVRNNAEQTKDFVYLNRPLEIRLTTDKNNRKLIIEDTGIGMTCEELKQNLGTIASSGSKQFMENIKEMRNNIGNPNIIGQFGLGFYSVFMVANKIEVFTRSSVKNSQGYRWYTDGLDHYEIQEMPYIDVGTKIVLHLKPDCQEYADENRVRDIIKKYSCFVRAPIYLNDKIINNLTPLWLMYPKDVLVSQYTDFYRRIAHTSDTPIYTFHFRADVPLSIRALIFFPKSTNLVEDNIKSDEIGVALYSHKILIQNKTKNLLPKWLRFVNGVVDSEDIPLNLSRELLQNSDVILKLQENITRRIVRFLQDCAKRDPVKYLQFYKNYGKYLREGIISNKDNKDREDLAKLLRFDCSKSTGKTHNTSLEDYCNMVGNKTKEIYYLIAPNRTLAEISPYYEGFKKRNIPVLFCYDTNDELALLRLKKFNNKILVSAEKALIDDAKWVPKEVGFGANALKVSEVDKLTRWLRYTLKESVVTVKATTRLESHPCVITVADMAAARQFMQSKIDVSDNNRLALLQTTFEINPKHTIIKKLHQLIDKDESLAKLIAEHLFTNSLIAAGLTKDPCILLTKINNLLVRFLERH